MLSTWHTQLRSDPSAWRLGVTCLVNPFSVPPGPANTLTPHGGSAWAPASPSLTPGHPKPTPPPQVICVDNFFTGSRDNVAHLIGRPNFEVIRHDVVEPILLEVDQVEGVGCLEGGFWGWLEPVFGGLGAPSCWGWTRRVEPSLGVGDFGGV
jgi:hypothetical protein